MTTPERITVSHDELRHVFGMGIAGNFTGHLEQAGEAADFVHIESSGGMPKGIFPWYVPGSENFLGTYPLSSSQLAIPASMPEASARMQIEPELGVLCEISRSVSGAITTLKPRWIAAFDDCSIRRQNARKISEKKNWGDASKGIAATALAIDSLDRSGSLASYRLSSFLVRDGEAHPYGVDSAVASYSLFGNDLVDWCIDRLDQQRSGDNTPLEHVGAMLDESRATSILIGVGATRYEPYGESTFVEAGDEAVVVVYDSNVHTAAQVLACIRSHDNDQLRSASVLRRIAVQYDSAYIS